MILAIGLVFLIGCSDDDNPSSSGSSLLGIARSPGLKKLVAVGLEGNILLSE